MVQWEESTCNAGDTGDVGSIPGLQRSLEKGLATHSSILAWRIPWTEEPSGLQSMGLLKSRTQLSMHVVVLGRLKGESFLYRSRR